MERHGLVIDVVPDRREEYLRLHASAWLRVEQVLRDCHVTNYTIFLVDDTLFADNEYAGDDHAADMATIAADPVTREWWTHTDPCQTPFTPGRDPETSGWREATEVWHLEH